MLSGPEIIQVLTDQVVGTFDGFCPDKTYSLPTQDWLTGAFGEAFDKFLFEFEESAWRPEINDCDDFSRSAAFFAQLLHKRKSKNDPLRKETALAFGEFFYTKDSGEGHAINVAIIRNIKGEHEAVFFEPQNQTIVELTQTEKESCEFFRF